MVLHVVAAVLVQADGPSLALMPARVATVVSRVRIGAAHVRLRQHCDVRRRQFRAKRPDEPWRQMEGGVALAARGGPAAGLQGRAARLGGDRRMALEVTKHCAHTAPVRAASARAGGPTPWLWGWRVGGQAPAPKTVLAPNATYTRLHTTKIPSSRRLLSLGAWYALQRSAHGRSGPQGPRGRGSRGLRAGGSAPGAGAGAR